LSLTLRRDRRLRVFQNSELNRIVRPKRHEVTGGSRGPQFQLGRVGEWMYISIHIYLILAIVVGERLALVSGR
jgi:hypothetical protein